ncbi:host-nuclease inhibitor Gam family protein, partial [Escherichia coli]|uniref:host-nuclease inhibitor Gam family protein n=1 Tax=Escherichia coli TaxID=562 RepID=UPI00201A9F6A
RVFLVILFTSFSGSLVSRISGAVHCIDHLQRHGASKKAITRAFDDDVEFQERMAEHIRYMVETIAHHQVDIDSEV